MALLKNKRLTIARLFAPLLVAVFVFGLCLVLMPASVSAQSSMDCNEGTLTATNCGIVKYLRDGIRVLSAMVGVIVVIMIAYGGLRYTTSHDNPQETAQAKSHIVNAIIALVCYIFVVAGLNWLVPGGIF